MENSVAAPQNTENILSVLSSNFSSGYISKELKAGSREFFVHPHSQWRGSECAILKHATLTYELFWAKDKKKKKKPGRRQILCPPYSTGQGGQDNSESPETSLDS